MSVSVPAVHEPRPALSFSRINAGLPAGDGAVMIGRLSASPSDGMSLSV